MRVAIVTGASSGMGEEFCRALDAEGLDCIWLVARRAEKLEALSSDLKTPCSIYSKDLTNREDLDSFMGIINDSDVDIRFIVNCAGAGVFGDTWEVSSEDTRMMIDLNVTALVEITRACVPRMEKGSWIIEVCSASAYLPLDCLNVYSSTKAFVHSFCEALRKEVRSKGISVLEVSPGWVSTDFIEKSKKDHNVPDKVFAHTVTQEAVVEEAMRDLRKGKKVSICGGYNKLQVWVCKHMTFVASSIWSKSLGKN